MMGWDVIFGMSARWQAVPLWAAVVMGVMRYDHVLMVVSMVWLVDACWWQEGSVSDEPICSGRRGGVEGNFGMSARWQAVPLLSAMVMFMMWYDLVLLGMWMVWLVDARVGSRRDVLRDVLRVPTCRQIGPKKKSLATN